MQRISSPPPVAARASAVPPADVTMCLTMARPSPVPCEERRAVGAEEPLEEARQVFVRHAVPGVRPREDDGVALVSGADRERRAGARVAQRVVDEVRGDRLQHPGPERQLEFGRAVDAECDPGVRRPLGARGDDLLEHGQRGCRAKRHDRAAALELAEEEDVVDELSDLCHLGTCLRRQRINVGSGEREALEQDHQPRERRAQLVRDGGREAGA